MSNLQTRLTGELKMIRDAGLQKDERIIESQQSAEIKVNGKTVLNFCANNYLGLSNHPHLVKAAQDGLDKWGFGLSSVRFICGTQTIHKELEKKLSNFLQMDDTILYTSCFDANGGLFETLLGAEDAIISDALNHASIIDGVRLCKAQRYRYANSDMAGLEEILSKTQNARTRLITTDGVFSMDGFVARLSTICDLADKYDAIVHVDDSHATGFFGKSGRGSIDYCEVMGSVDIVTSTLGKAMGGASGGFTSGKQEIIDILRQRSRPYLFSNTVAPAIVCASIAVLDMLTDSTDLRDTLEKNTLFFRDELTKNGFDIKKGEHPIVPIMLYDAKLAQNIASDMLEKGIYVIGFSFPVVPKNEARIRVQISAAHTNDHLKKAISSFVEIGKKHGVIN
ncbi:MAG: glycine C-acetyltransferase [Candidatus Marinimicrobia bacterium]|jgi:glycine C-acetyltransferase|nr:glycine C-acetyltransferase [Candidatus Neomarinimicrobiota bacterium]MBT3633128.1 glycine C-acetyltransferase [Candidatus Neomarinimicrobiota bacterium]MBT3682271.1 glycine C-acetyltransferase [Candidatus Neomarinimicrobiota bacterium]MBT3758728.1 glycine C-acetyltransferase [Candidatus Neomarinimicrobiota bacterium]MBT3895398.1 glycine C-acetyltransferase [Candidatus Neomarinimicrobiota bacterium]